MAVTQDAPPFIGEGFFVLDKNTRQNRFLLFIEALEKERFGLFFFFLGAGDDLFGDFLPIGIE